MTPEIQENDTDHIRTLEQERMHQRHALKVMETMEQYCETNSNTLLDFSSQEFKEYFEALHTMNRLNFVYIQDTFSEKQLQQFSFLIDKEYLTDIENSRQLKSNCKRYCESVTMTPIQEIPFLEALQS